MDLLNDNQTQMKQQPAGTKAILVLIILSVILIIGIVILMILIQSTKQARSDLYINGQKIENSRDLLITDTETGKKYISIKDIANLLEYQYNNSGYQGDAIETAKCYIKNKNLIAGFEIGSKRVYKYEEGTDLDYQYFELNNEIKTLNDKICIALEDLTVGINVEYGIDAKGNIIINTIEYLANQYQEKLKDNGYIVAEDQNNQKALAYGYIIVKKDDRYSVLNTKFEEIISSRYTSIYFDEPNMSYIVSNTNGKYGIITTEGTLKMQFIYDGLEVLNYEKMLYKAKNGEKYGVVDANGRIIVNMEYEDIGYPSDPANRILYTLIIEKMDETPGETIVVKKDKKYGLVVLETGELYLPCDHLDKLYSVSELGKIQYKAEVDKKTYNLAEYLRMRLTQTLNL